VTDGQADGDFDAEFDPPTPGQAEFDELIAQAIASVPEPFASRLDTVAIVVDDEATPEQLASVRAYGLFGLYQGVPRTRYAADQAAVPSKITIFRRPLEAVYRDRTALAQAVTDTVLHEIAHHFGISDERLRELARERQRSA
jgi:predicted Zn-dependent protease with MMP-like domain